MSNVLKVNNIDPDTQGNVDTISDGRDDVHALDKSKSCKVFTDTMDIINATLVKKATKVDVKLTEDNIAEIKGLANFDAPSPINLKDAKVAIDANASKIGVPKGGTTRQALVKKSDADGDIEWKNTTGGISDIVPGSDNVHVAIDDGVATISVDGGGTGQDDPARTQIKAVQGTTNWDDPVPINLTTAKAAITINTSKVGITPTQASAIVNNSAKISYTDKAKVDANTAKKSFTDTDKAHVTTNTAKVSYDDKAKVTKNTSDIATNKTDIGNKANKDVVRTNIISSDDSIIITDTENNGIDLTANGDGEGMFGEGEGFIASYDNKPIYLDTEYIPTEIKLKKFINNDMSGDWNNNIPKNWCGGGYEGGTTLYRDKDIQYEGHDTCRLHIPAIGQGWLAFHLIDPITKEYVPLVYGIEYVFKIQFYVSETYVPKVFLMDNTTSTSYHRDLAYMFGSYEPNQWHTKTIKFKYDYEGDGITEPILAFGTYKDPSKTCDFNIGGFSLEMPIPLAEKGTVSAKKLVSKELYTKSLTLQDYDIEIVDTKDDEATNNGSIFCLDTENKKITNDPNCKTSSFRINEKGHIISNKVVDLYNSDDREDTYQKIALYNDNFRKGFQEDALDRWDDGLGINWRSMGWSRPIYGEYTRNNDNGHTFLHYPNNKYGDSILKMKSPAWTITALNMFIGTKLYDPSDIRGYELKKGHSYKVKIRVRNSSDTLGYVGLHEAAQPAASLTILLDNRIVTPINTWTTLEYDFVFQGDDSDKICISLGDMPDYATIDKYERSLEIAFCELYHLEPVIIEGYTFSAADTLVETLNLNGTEIKVDPNITGYPLVYDHGTKSVINKCAPRILYENVRLADAKFSLHKAKCLVGAYNEYQTLVTDDKLEFGGIVIDNKEYHNDDSQFVFDIQYVTGTNKVIIDCLLDGTSGIYQSVGTDHINATIKLFSTDDNILNSIIIGKTNIKIPAMIPPRKLDFSAQLHIEVDVHDTTAYEYGTMRPGRLKIEFNDLKASPSSIPLMYQIFQIGIRSYLPISRSE